MGMCRYAFESIYLARHERLRPRVPLQVTLDCREQLLWGINEHVMSVTQEEREVIEGK